MLTVACVLSDGPTYDLSHVRRLQDMVSENLSVPYRFVCLNDSPFPGWWAKISLFKPRRFKERVLYLDLDVTITGPLDDLADYGGPFVAISDWNRRGLNSSVMTWDAGVADHLFTEFDETVMERLDGDQDWITEQMPDAAMFPLGWCVSYKRQGGRSPSTAKVCVFHGRPKPWEVPEVA